MVSFLLIRNSMCVSKRSLFILFIAQCVSLTEISVVLANVVYADKNNTADADYYSHVINGIDGAIRSVNQISVGSGRTKGSCVTNPTNLNSNTSVKVFRDDSNLDQALFCSNYLNSIRKDETKGSLLGAIPNTTNVCKLFSTKGRSRYQNRYPVCGESNHANVSTIQPVFNNLDQVESLERGYFVKATLSKASEKLLNLRSEVHHLMNARPKRNESFCEQAFLKEIQQKCYNENTVDDTSCKDSLSRSELLEKSKNAILIVQSGREKIKEIDRQISELEDTKIFGKDSVMLKYEKQRLETEKAIISETQIVKNQNMYPWAFQNSASNVQLEKEFDKYLNNMNQRIEESFLEIQDVGHCSVENYSGLKATAKCITSGITSLTPGYYQGMALAMELNKDDSENSYSNLDSDQVSYQTCIHERMLDQKNTASVIGLAAVSSYPLFRLIRVGAMATKAKSLISEIPKAGVNLSRAISNPMVTGLANFSTTAGRVIIDGIGYASVFEVLEKKCGFTPGDLESQVNTSSSNQCLFSKKRLVAQESKDACLKQVVTMTALAGKANVALMTTKLPGSNNNGTALDGHASTSRKDIVSENKIVKQAHIVRENNYMTITGNYKLKPKTKKDIIKYFDHHNREVVHLSYRVREAHPALASRISVKLLDNVAVHDAVKKMPFETLKKEFGYQGVPIDIISGLDLKFIDKLKLKFKKSADGKYYQLDIIDQINILWGTSPKVIQDSLKVAKEGSKESKHWKAMDSLFKHTVTDAIGSIDDQIAAKFIASLTPRGRVALRMTEAAADWSARTGNPLTSHELGQKAQGTADYIASRKSPEEYLLYKLAPTKNPIEEQEARQLIAEMGGLVVPKPGQPVNEGTLLAFFNQTDAMYIDTRKVMSSYNETVQKVGNKKQVLTEGRFIPM